MSCYLTALSLSNIYCRPPITNQSSSQPGLGAGFCHPSFEFPPICQPDTEHCNYTAGGGCCPLGTACTVDGCKDVVQFVFPSAAALAAPTDCEVGGCEGNATDLPELLAHDQLPTSSTLPNSGSRVVPTQTQTDIWQPATWTVTVTGSKTGEVCDPASTATTAGVPSGAGRMVVPFLGADGGHTCKLSILVTGCLVLGVGFLF